MFLGSAAAKLTKGALGSAVPQEATYNTFGFDAVDDYISVASDSTLNFGGTTSISMAAWLWIDSAGNGTFRTVIRQDGGYYIRLTDGNKLFWKVYGSADLTSTVNPPTDQWVFIACTYDGSNLRYYEDGVLKDTQACTGNMPTVTGVDVTVGRTTAFPPPNEEFWNGSMAYPMIWNTVLSSTDITNLYNSGKIPYYETLPASLKSGNVLALELSSRDATANDLSGNGNNGTKNGGVSADGSIQTFASYS